VIEEMSGGVCIGEIALAGWCLSKIKWRLKPASDESKCL